MRWSAPIYVWKLEKTLRCVLKKTFLLHLTGIMNHTTSQYKPVMDSKQYSQKNEIPMSDIQDWANINE